MSSVLNEATIKLIRDAIAFADWAAGEGICPAGYNDPTAAERNPDEFLFAYSSATHDEDWGTVATRVSAEITRLQAELEAMRTAAASARDAGIEDAANVAEKFEVEYANERDKHVPGTPDHWMNNSGSYAAMDIAAAIRELKVKP